MSYGRRHNKLFTVTEVNGSFSLIKSGRKMRRTRIDIRIKKRKKKDKGT